MLLKTPIFLFIELLEVYITEYPPESVFSLTRYVSRTAEKF